MHFACVRLFAHLRLKFALPRGQALTADPSNGAALGNYATLMYTVRGDYDVAEAMYSRALLLDPDNVDNLLNYATFLQARPHSMYRGGWVWLHHLKTEVLAVLGLLDGWGGVGWG